MQGLETVAQIISTVEMDAQSFPWAALRYQHTQALYSRLLEQYSPATANKMMAAVSRVLEEAWKLGQMSAEDYHRAIALERKSNQRLPRGRTLSAGEVQALMSVCCQDESVKGCRDAALIAVLHGAGLRRAEVVTLELAN